MREQFSASGGKAVKLVATDTPQFIAGIGELGHARTPFSARTAHFPFPRLTNVRQPSPSIQRMLHTPTCHMSTCGSSSRIGAPRQDSPPLGLPARATKPRNTEIPLSPKNLSSGTARARARAKSRFFDHPLYSAHVNAIKPNPDQPRQSGGKAGNWWSKHFARCVPILSLASWWTGGHGAHARASEQGIPAHFACSGERCKANGNDTPPLVCAGSDGFEDMRTR
jgi:hypothetical protein